MLLEAGADVNMPGENGTCLHEAALYGKTGVVKLLLEVRQLIICTAHSHKCQGKSTIIYFVKRDFMWKIMEYHH